MCPTTPCLMTAGFGILVVSQSGDLIAYGSGVRTDFVTDSGGAETWGLNTAVSEAMVTSAVNIDSLGLFGLANAGTCPATAASSRNANCWTLICNRLDGDLGELADKLVWIPAHQTAAVIRNRHLSVAKRIAAMDWRANRLVDKLAQREAAAQINSKPANAAVKGMTAEVKHGTALLGVVTAASNKCKDTFTLSDGSLKTVTKRGAQAPPTACMEEKEAKLAAKAEAKRAQVAASWEEAAANAVKADKVDFNDAQAAANTVRRMRRRNPTQAAPLWVAEPVMPGRMTESHRLSAAQQLAESANTNAASSCDAAPPAGVVLPTSHAELRVWERAPRSDAAARARPARARPGTAGAKLQEDEVLKLLSQL